MANPECTGFIAQVPTVWDETKVLDGKIGEYIVTARRKGNTWYVGGLTNWTPRDLTIDLGFMAPGSEVELFSDGVNAHRNARDYSRKVVKTGADGKLKIHLAPGGGFALKSL